ncbi:dihydrofolate reductase family protein [Amycolatopsis minnesotensis]|uniref:Dihydrofolate reductase family protein n=1 Tax=Amycolatopsis minnesotensis TaxID=337894 RepID=A0ABN2QDL8_9PSEU
MGTLTVMEFASLDGVVQAPGGEEDAGGGFRHGGWAVPHFDEEMIERIAERTERAAALLLGRGTYDIFAATWPLAEPDDRIGAKLNGMPKHVASRTLKTVSWQNSALLTGDAAEAVAALKRDVEGEIQVHGSVGLVQTLLRHDLVDELRLFTFPVLVGSGQQLFAHGTIPAKLRLVATETSATGVVASTYARDGDLTYGAMGPETGNW